MLQLVLFFVFGIIAVAAAVNLLAQRHPINSALSLIVVMASLATLFLLMGAEFLAAIQVIVYAGAIMVLFVFVIMLLNAGAEEHTNLSKMAQLAGLPLAFFLAFELVYWVAKAGMADSSAQTAASSTRALSMLLFQKFVFPFELTSILILIAILGAVVLAQRER
jgi:NADH-quinone oxidoreductase subunit J